MTARCQDCGVDPATLTYTNPANRHLRRGRCHACYLKAWRRRFAPKCRACDGHGYLVAERSA